MKSTIVLFILISLLYSCESNHTQNNEEETIVNIEVNNEIPEENEVFRLTTSDLNIVSSLTVNNEIEYFEEGKSINEYVKIELIDKELFEEKKSTSVDFLIDDTNISRKKGDTLELKTKTGIKQYIDVPREFEDATKINDYMGYIDFLNQYLIMFSYYEGTDFEFVNIINGKTTRVFDGYPYIMSDSNNVICLEDNPYEFTADFEIYSIKGKDIEHVTSMSFKYWMSYDKFVSSDGYLYVSVNHITSYWNKNGGLNDERQYIRLKLI